MEQIKIELSKLNPTKNNVRRHTEVQLRELLKSVKQFGQTRAIVIDEEYNILIGNGLYQAMKIGGYETADAYMIKGLSEKDKKKLMLSDNKIFSLGLDNNEEIQKLIDEISQDEDYSIPGFDEDILREMTRTIEQVQKDMNDYGVLSSQKVEEMKETPAPAPITSTPKAVQNEAPTPTVNNFSNNKEPRKVICPSCGEVIYLD